MKKVKHNKKRNVGIIYELLVSNMANFLLIDDRSRANKIKEIIESHFHSSTELFKEYRVFKALTKNDYDNDYHAISILSEVKKDFKNNPKFLDWILSTDKINHIKLFKQNIKPFEILFFSVGAEILKNISGFIAVSPDLTVQKMRKEVIKALNDLKGGGNVQKLKQLKKG